MCEFKQGKECMRTSLKIDAKYLLGNMLALGNVANISDDCMCINTRYCIPLHSIVKLFLPLKKKVLNVAVRVSRYSDTEGHLDTMSVDVLNPPADYLDYTKSLSLTLQ